MVKSNIKSWTDHEHFALFESQMYKSMSAQICRSMVQRIWGLCTITLRIRDECAVNIVLKNPHHDGKEKYGSAYLRALHNYSPYQR